MLWYICSVDVALPMAHSMSDYRVDVELPVYSSMKKYTSTAMGLARYTIHRANPEFSASAKTL